MNRGSRVLILLVIVIIVLVGVTYFVLQRGLAPAIVGGKPTATSIPVVNIVVVGQPINRDDVITKESLIVQPYAGNPSEKWITDPQKAIGKYAAFPLAQGLPLTTDMLADRPGLSQPGSEAAKVVSPGLVAISIPIDRMGLVDYAIKDGDKVNVIVTNKFIDVDPNFQSKLPNDTAVVTGPGFLPSALPILSANIASSGTSSAQGRAELDPTLNQALYLVPSEAQRPRLVSQMILQDIQVLRVGVFDIATPAPSGGATPTPGPTPTGQPAAAPIVPTSITLIVTPQDAVALAYLIHTDAIFTLTLRAPDDTTRIETEAATLQYLLSQYAIPVPAKLPYVMDNVVATPAP